MSEAPLKKEDVTIEMFEEKMELAISLKEEHAKMKRDTADKYHEYEETLLELHRYCSVLDKKEYASEKVGKFSFKYEEGYSLGADDVNREKFFNYLKERDMFDTLITVNSQSLNSFVKDEVAAKEDEGDFEFVPPGVIRRDPRLKFSLTKKRK